MYETKKEGTLRDQTVSTNKGTHFIISSSQTCILLPFFIKRRATLYRYEVKFQNGQECGGAYVKLLTEDKTFEPVCSCSIFRI